MAQRCEELKIKIPQSGKAHGVYSSVIVEDNIAYTSGQTARVNGEVAYAGRLGDNLTVEEGRDAARQCLLNCLALLQAHCGGLDNIDRFIRMTGYVNCTSDFYEISKVVDGASELLHSLFGEKGLPVRCALGMNSLPKNSACEIELSCKLKENAP